ncbi:unnamed protein product [Ceutorhynchus assimilis]|uniref:Replication protein A subunit n=1 Tax=Ceutorhynchus assimilis TaxID=467358 RepID=A0A9N9MU20_9CUCU|nr:unnamed protein product [Ceutorhynchus assimilis]
MSEKLSSGALETIMRGGEYTEPVVQVLSIKKMNSGSGQPEKDRYRIYLSDGQYTVSHAMMTAQIYAKAGPKGLPRFSIIKIIRSMTSVINNTDGRDSRVLLILDLELLKDGDEVGVKIGDPIPYSEAASARPKPSGTGPSTSVQAEVEPVAKRMKLATNGTNGTYDGNTTLGGHITHPISSLSPYHNKWIIKVRVMSKSDIRKWENARGSGQLFSVDLCDESGEIRLTAFGTTVDKYYDVIQVDKVYYISKCQVKPANKQFNTVKNDYEMTMTSDTIVEECLDDDMKNLQIQYNFVDIAKIAEVEPNSTVDVFAIAKSYGEVNSFQAKTTGRELKKREVQLVDKSNATITLTLWGQQAENFNGFDNPVVLLKGARVTEFGGGKNLGTTSSTLMKVNPDMEESFTLKGWFTSAGSSALYNDLSARTAGGGTGSYNTPWLTFKEVIDQQLGSINTASGDYYMVKATVLLIRSENSIYKACPTDGCNKKVVDNNDGTYRCEKCQQDFQNYKFRLLCSMNVGDWSGNQWVSMFSDEAEKVIGMSAQEVGELGERDPDGLSKMMESLNFKEFILKCRAKMETYNDEQRLKTVAVKVDPINYKEYNAYLAKKIRDLIA